MALTQLLIIHTDPTACKRVASPLLRSGYFKLKIASDPFSAAAELFSGEFDCAILHIDTPGLNTINAISRIRSTEKTALIPIIVLASAIDQTLERSLKSVGANELLLDQISLQDLAEIILKHTSLLDESNSLDPSKVDPPKVDSPEVDPQKPADQPEAEIIPTAEVEKTVNIFAGSLDQFADQSPPEDNTHEPAESQATDSPADSPVDSRPKPRPSPARSDDDPVTDDRTRRRAFQQIWAAVLRGESVPGIPAEVPGIDRLIGDISAYGISKYVVGLDLNLAIGILRQVNSIEYRALDTISGLSRAMQRVGVREISQRFRNSWMSRKQVSDLTRDFMLNHFTRHSLMVACLAEEIANFVRDRDADAIFSAGLLHDVGKLFLVHHFPESYATILEGYQGIWDDQGEFYDVATLERDLMKIDHGTVGYELCRVWSMPPAVQAGTIHHEENSDARMRINESRAVRIVGIADLLERITRNNEICDTIRTAQEAGHEPGGIPTEPCRMEDYVEDLDQFFRSPDRQIPPWIHKFIHSKRVPMRYVYERARFRVQKTMASVDMAA